ncbi:hypothetical protein SEUBUCD646_0E01150 [Saccharomyces eubayanus]|uniref:FIR1-like protein n=1 Tax=Saccharomyces eubayanus TaxID=1080349 RepID=A0ABN8VRG7_SACEU|nr:hypothetical protein SEUBUCD650_0E01190 [Saccharomyces eubayanus]CAI1978720.1 hypothetical protein SEUBUCD646_0E01150 [Saccharomyces eubayanus]
MSLPSTPVKSKVHSALSMEQEMDFNLSRDIPYPLENGPAIPQFDDTEFAAVPRQGWNKNKKPNDHTQSQVRFSIPDPNELSQDSPLKIVYPKSVDEIQREISTASLFMNSHGHLVDMRSKILVDVPEEVWKFHHNRKVRNENSHRRTRSDARSYASSKLKSPSHSRSRSLQSIIVDTMNTYRTGDADTTSNENTSNVSQVSPLNISFDKLPPLTPQRNLYLTPESPLNKYRLPVPLEISLPPYLSPQNKHKQRNSLVYDGDGYSQFQECNTSSSTESSLEQPSSSYSDGNNSIPYAHHDISFELNNADPDKFLGIDGNANVNLKIQRRNLRSPQHIKKKSDVRSEQEGIENNKSLKILSTPNKLIDIPDLDDMKSPPSAGLNGTLKFFQHFEPCEAPAPSPNNFNPKSQDKLDMSFKFPASSANNNTGEERANKDFVDTNNEDFLKIDTSPVNQSIELRRQMLMDLQKSPTSNDPRMHKHRRSRSVHNIDDNFLKFDATSTPPAPAPAPISPVENCTPYTSPEIPERSPLRFKSSPNTPSVKSPQNNSFRQEMSVPSIQIIPDETTSNTVDSSITENPEEKTGPKSFSIEDADKSIAIIRETKKNPTVEPFKPLSSFNSFSLPIQTKKRSPLEQSLTELATKQQTYAAPPSLPLNTVSPKRQLSNSGSSKSSSYNSEFSANTGLTDATSQPSVTANRSILQQNLKNQKKSNNNIDFRPHSQKNNFSFPRKGATPTPERVLEFNTIYEKRNGKMVEVILLDEDEDSSVESNISPQSKLIQAQKSKNEQDKKNLNYYNEVLDMCEKTADEAKKIIYQLVDETARYPKNKQTRSRVLPPLPFPLYDQNGNSLNTNKYGSNTADNIPRQQNNLR